jgi:pyruvate/2-oxoacid:ferredoxin oxidoreductase alpha subunit
MKELLTGNQAISQGVMLSRAEVISAFPITPQTSVVEELAQLRAEDKLHAHGGEDLYGNLVTGARLHA